MNALPREHSYKSPSFISVQYVSLSRGDSVAIYAATIRSSREGKILSY